MSDPKRISAAEARRIALAAQGFRSRRSQTPPSTGQIVALISQLGLLQIDSVNVFRRAHYVPIFSRLGPYDTTRLDRLAGHTAGRLDRRLVEYWAHEASLVPLSTHPLLRWRMANLPEAWGSIRRIVREDPELVQRVLALVAEEGPVRARDTGIVPDAPPAGRMWNWHAGKVALEYLFFIGRIGAARRINFERRYDLIERILPAEILNTPTPEPEEAQAELVRISARALGVATTADLADYFRLPMAVTRRALDTLVRSGELFPAQVSGWEEPAYMWHEAKRPRRLEARALLSPFDSLIFFRPRTERLFGFRYRIEIYTPAAKRQYGYYVLPFLLGDRLVARVDLKSDRASRVLRVQSAHLEPGADVDEVAGELAEELRRTAGWLDLDGVESAGGGDLAEPLRRALS